MDGRHDMDWWHGLNFSRTKFVRYRFKSSSLAIDSNFTCRSCVYVRIFIFHNSMDKLWLTESPAIGWACVFNQFIGNLFSRSRYTNLNYYYNIKFTYLEQCTADWWGRKSWGPIDYYSRRTVLYVSIINLIIIIGPFIFSRLRAIKSLTVEWDNMAEGQDALVRFMEESGFIKIGAFEFQYSRDVIFIKDLINV